MLMNLFVTFFLAKSGGAPELLTHQALIQCESEDRKTTVTAIIPGDNRDTGFILKTDYAQMTLINESLLYTLGYYYAPDLRPFSKGRVVSLKAHAQSSINYGWTVSADAQDESGHSLLKFRSVRGTEQFENIEGGRAGQFLATIQIADPTNGELGPAREVDCIYSYVF